MAETDLDALSGAYRPGFEFHDENLAMLEWYAGRILELIRLSGVRSLASLGLGHGVVAETLIRELGGDLGRYVIIEGSREIIDGFHGRPDTLPPTVRMVNALFEDFRTDEPFDAIEMGFVLEHVEDPAAILERYASMLRRGGRIFIAVPNAASLHRQIGHEAGLLDELTRLSPQDLQLGHRRYFDLDSIEALVRSCRLEILRCEGIFLKPVTTDQLRRLDLPEAVQRALFRLGARYPELSNAIMLEVRV